MRRDTAVSVGVSFSGVEMVALTEEIPEGSVFVSSLGATLRRLTPGAEHDWALWSAPVFTVPLPVMAEQLRKDPSLWFCAHLPATPVSVGDVIITGEGLRRLPEGACVKPEVDWALLRKAEGDCWEAAGMDGAFSSVEVAEEMGECTVLWLPEGDA